MEPASKLAAPSGNTPQTSHKRRHGFIFQSCQSASDFEGSLILQLATQQDEQIVHEDQELILHLSRYGSRTPGPLLVQQILANVEEFLDVPPQPIELGDEPGGRMGTGGGAGATWKPEGSSP